MNKFKPLIVLGSVLIALSLIIPSLLVIPFSEGKAIGKLGGRINSKAPPKRSVSLSKADEAIEVSVYRSRTKRIEKVPLEEYLVGVVAAEMPAEFKEEALKAQALTARTYIVNRLLSKDTTGAPKGAEVTDTPLNQAYESEDELKKAWGMDYNKKYKKILDAVRATSGQIITYDGKPIQAQFFSTSNGYTENSEDYWSGSIPYLRSVSSPWDENSPKFNGEIEFTVKDFENRLGVKIGTSGPIGKIIAHTAGKRVAKVDFNGKILTGKDIREKLGLMSSDFSWQRKGNMIVVTTKGYGHGVGMSQYGANGMAAEGKTYKDIVEHYYSGVQITSADSLLEMMTAKN